MKSYFWVTCTWWEMYCIHHRVKVWGNSMTSRMTRNRILKVSRLCLCVCIASLSDQRRAILLAWGTLCREAKIASRSGDEKHCKKLTFISEHRFNQILAMMPKRFGFDFTKLHDSSSVFFSRELICCTIGLTMLNSLIQLSCQALGKL